MTTNTGVNLLNPGETPYENAQFLLFLCAVLKAVDEYQDILRVSAASAGNDHRLGAAEAPPAVISVFLGDELTAVLSALEKEKTYNAKEKTLMRVGVHVLPKFPKDTTDRNRTSPFAFTGNKFEFRMVGSAMSVSDCNTFLNTAVAEILSGFADELEGVENFEHALHDLIVKTIREHKRIIFNGNGYDEAWIKEAERRGLYNLKTTPQAIPMLLQEKNIALFCKHKVLTEREIRARYEIMLEGYVKVLNIEAQTMVDMVSKDILPAVSGYGDKLARTAVDKKNAIGSLACKYEIRTLEKLSECTDAIYDGLQELKQAIVSARAEEDKLEMARAFETCVIPAMKTLRESVDLAESMTAYKEWPYPTYGDLLFGIKN
jgi:glutamine synthetase